MMRMNRARWLGGIAATTLLLVALPAFYVPARAQTARSAASERVLYQINSWETTLGWSSTDHRGWYAVNGQLLYDGGGSSAILAPLRLAHVWNYAVEATISTTGQHGNYNDGYGFGLVFRAKKGLNLYPHMGAPSALGAGMSQSSAAITGVWVYLEDNALDSSDFDPGTSWHTYRIEVRGNSLRLLVDGQVAAQAASNQFLGNPRVGLYSVESEISVRSFKVYAI